MSFLRYRWVVKVCLVCVLILSGNISEAKATNYYVAASNGNDGNRGTLQEPFRTLERGVSVLIPGDTLFVRGGTYLGTHNLADIPNGNSWEQPVSIKAYAQEKGVITALPGRSALYFNDGSHHIIIEGFVFDAKGGANGLQFGSQSHHIRILNSEVMNSSAQGILATEPSNDLELIGLKVHDNGTHSGQDHGIYMAGSSNIIEGCDIYRNAARGIQIFSTANTPNKMVVRNNRVYDNGVLGVSGFGIGIYKGSDHQVYNNLVWGNNMGIVVWGGANAKVFNNTVHANSLYGIWLASGSLNSLIKNNIASLNGGNGIIITKGSGSPQIFNNLVAATNSSNGLKNWEGSATLKGNVAGSINDIKYANHQNRDFHLQQGSLAIAAGVVLPEVKYDFDYASRNQTTAYDIGAFSVNGTPPPANTIASPSSNTPPPPSSNTPPPSSSTPTSSSLSISNLTVASGQAYVVPSSGLQTGARAYIDRSYTFTSVPTSVQGGAYIQTANNDKTATTDAFLRFSVTQPVSVYVAHDGRHPLPSWMNIFTDTGANLVTSDTTLDLFVRTFPAGTITLGGNASSGGSMYSVILKQ